jgi:hypothetical protein
MAGLNGRPARLEARLVPGEAAARPHVADARGRCRACGGAVGDDAYTDGLSFTITFDSMDDEDRGERWVA